jgi:hypothetical protein
MVLKPIMTFLRWLVFGRSGIREHYTRLAGLWVRRVVGQWLSLEISF